MGLPYIIQGLIVHGCVQIMSLIEQNHYWSLDHKGVPSVGLPCCDSSHDPYQQSTQQFDIPSQHEKVCLAYNIRMQYTNLHSIYTSLPWGYKSAMAFGQLPLHVFEGTRHCITQSS